MSVARACRRFRIKIKNDPRYNRAARRDSGARAARLRRQLENEKARLQRSANKGR